MKRITCRLIILIMLLTTIMPLGAQEHNPALVTEIKSILSDYYVDPVPTQVLLQDTIPKVLTALGDPYTHYFTDQEFAEYWSSIEGKIGGIGIVFNKVSKGIEIAEVIKDTPAFKANLEKGDIVTHVDHQPLGQLPLTEILQLFRGNPGTSVELEIYRPQLDLYFTYLLTREFITIQPIQSHILGKNIGYIKIEEFTQEAGKEFPKHLNNLKAQGIKGLILDLRDNPGGLITVALDISKELVPPGPFLQLIYRGQKPEMISTTGSTQILPLIVLVNSDSASASEILTGAIQDRKSGIILGTTTYGKASVQSLHPLENGGALKFTSGRYLTAHGRQIREVGLTPDFYIQDPQEQLDQAIKILQNPGKKIIIYQNNNHKTLINGNLQELALAPYMKDEHFMIPLRKTVEALGGTITFTPPSSIKVSLEQHSFKMQINTLEFSHNDQVKRFSVGPEIRNQITTLPASYLEELLDAHIEWQTTSGQMTISY